MAKADPIRLGLAGLGRAGWGMHCEELKGKADKFRFVAACDPLAQRRRQMADVIFRETTTIGLRHYEVDRECLQREIVTVETPIGAVRFKVARRNGAVLNASAEFDDVVMIAERERRPVKEIQALVTKAYLDTNPR